MNYNNWTVTSRRDDIEDHVRRGVQQKNDKRSSGNSNTVEMNIVEDLLVRAGVVAEEFSATTENAQWMQCQHLPTSTPSHQIQTPARKRVATGGDVGQRIVQRRQKRMIKNRESAARSRARKQAYTHELEMKVSRLEEENRRLREPKVEIMLPYVSCPEPKNQLHRTTSAPF